ncbi:MAG: hypothetical protein FWF23_03055 [Alphaproteobacteria bacterium]|nr:hypothetical protein [Alphaproteobacteria bacterium]MCL2505390.1 hypothetical protein [Alphaproteobacteria bacterium]
MNITKILIGFVFAFVLIFTPKAYADDFKVPLPGKTQADARLQFDTLKNVYVSVGVLERDCNNFSVINTELVQELQEGSWKEEWTVNACGTNVYVPITFIASKAGGTTFLINLRAIHK